MNTQQTIKHIFRGIMSFGLFKTTSSSILVLLRVFLLVGEPGI